MPDRSRCPNCGERLSPYAAGCAVCGADIDFRRWDSGPGPLARAGAWFSALGHGGEVRRVPARLIVFMVMFGGSLAAAVLALVR
jgi:uncharacterized protein (DUF983 family)